MSGPDDKAALIVAIARTGDRAAFSNLFMFFAPRVKSYLLRLGMGNGEAEDLAQETLLTVWRKAASFDPERAGASTWIFTIARNLRLDAARRAVGERYLRDNIKYGFGAAELAGLTAFYAYAAETGVIDAAAPVRFY